MASSYRGYPYTQTVVTQAPSLTGDQVAQLARWNNLPVRKVTTKAEPAPVVYVDLPEDGGGQTTPSQPPSLREEEDETPVIYVELPEHTTSGVSQPTPDEEPAFVQDTILYDQFKDERIRVPETSDPQPAGSRPQPPNSLNLAAPGSSSGSTLPPYLSKQTQVYSPIVDEFNLPPLPVSDFPLPPPSYEEAERSEAVQVIDRPVTSQPVVGPPVQVITNSSTYQIPSSSEMRKFLYCYHCRTQVHSIVIKENGPLTHIFAWMFLLLCLFPLTILLYMTNFFKYKYHYCPSCNNKIAFEMPFACTGLTYIND